MPEFLRVRDIRPPDDEQESWRKVVEKFGDEIIIRFHPAPFPQVKGELDTDLIEKIREFLRNEQEPWSLPSDWWK